MSVRLTTHFVVDVGGGVNIAVHFANKFGQADTFTDT